MACKVPTRSTWIRCATVSSRSIYPPGRGRTGGGDRNDKTTKGDVPLRADAKITSPPGTGHHGARTPGASSYKQKLFSSLSVVPGLCSNPRGSPARVAGFRAGSAPPFERSPAANGPCAPPGGFSADWRSIAARAAFGRRFESPYLQFHNTAFSKASGSLIGVQPKIEHFVPDGSSCPEDIGFEHELGPHGIENGMRRRGNPIDFKVFAHDQENVEIFRGISVTGYETPKLPAPAA